MGCHKPNSSCQRMARGLAADAARKNKSLTVERVGCCIFFVELATQYSCDAHTRECISADRPPSLQNGILLPGFPPWHFGVAYLCAYAVYLFIGGCFRAPRLDL